MTVCGYVSLSFMWEAEGKKSKKNKANDLTDVEVKASHRNQIEEAKF